MADSTSNKDLIEEIKHKAVPGYPRVFAIAIVVMGLYLAIILISSRGKVKYGDSHTDKHGKHVITETSHDAEESKSH
ncbi:MAG: hypothetical protein CMO61_00530 [Verrucomicrobiales bacterium]|jgi:hypothetical protein|nr:hypothetical protein [Verrucomicrobiales bacterium]|tara:strand:+ start:28992 stop:29222 length:231 start_codon:yes stop_codon:yes gene_type:complete